MSSDSSLLYLDDAIGLLLGLGDYYSSNTPVKGTHDHETPSKTADDGTEGERVIANPPWKTKKGAGGAVSANDANANRRQVEEEFRKIWNEKRELSIQEAAIDKELAMKDLEARLVMENTTAIEKLHQERSAEKMKASYKDEIVKCKTKALIECKKSHTKELEGLELKLSKEKNAVIVTIQKRLHDAKETIKKLKKEAEESKSNAADAVSEAVEKAIEQTTVDHQVEIDRIKKKHDTKLSASPSKEEQRGTSLIKVDTEREIKALHIEKQNCGPEEAVEKIRSEANEQIAGLKNKLAQLEKDREQLKLRLDISEQWLKERDSLRIEVDHLKKDASTTLHLLKERDSLQNEVIDLTKQLSEKENEAATLNQAREFRPSELANDTTPLVQVKPVPPRRSILQKEVFKKYQKARKSHPRRDQWTPVASPLKGSK